MLTKTTIAAALIALTSLTAVPAQALTVDFNFGGPGYGWGGSGYGWNGGQYQGWSGDYSDHRDHFRHRLSRQEVRWMLRERGYRNIRFVDDHGPVYELRARRHGDTYYLVVSARSGEILSRNRI